MTSIFISLTTALLTLSASTWANVAGMSACHNAIQTLSYQGEPSSFSIKPNLLLIPNSLNDQPGFYIYTESKTYFCTLPENYEPLHGNVRNYRIKIQLRDLRPVYLDYQHDRFHPLSPALSSGSHEPITGGSEGYTSASCREMQTERSTQLATSTLRSRIADVHRTFQEAYERASQTEREQRRSEAVDALKTCENVASLAGFVRQELAKFTAGTQRQDPSSSGRRGSPTGN